MKIKRFLTMVVGAFILHGCAGKVEKTITGFWAIDKSEFFYKGENLFFDMLGNMITFNRNHTCGLPVTLENRLVSLCKSNNCKI